MQNIFAVVVPKRFPGIHFVLVFHHGFRQQHPRAHRRADAGAGHRHGHIGRVANSGIAVAHHHRQRPAHRDLFLAAAAQQRFADLRAERTHLIERLLQLCFAHRRHPADQNVHIVVLCHNPRNAALALMHQKNLIRDVRVVAGHLVEIAAERVKAFAVAVVAVNVAAHRQPRAQRGVDTGGVDHQIGVHHPVGRADAHNAQTVHHRRKDLGGIDDPHAAFFGVVDQHVVDLPALKHGGAFAVGRHHQRRFEVRVIVFHVAVEAVVFFFRRLQPAFRKHAHVDRVFPIVAEFTADLALIDRHVIARLCQNRAGNQTAVTGARNDYFFAHSDSPLCKRCFLRGRQIGLPHNFSVIFYHIFFNM